MEKEKKKYRRQLQFPVQMIELKGSKRHLDKEVQKDLEAIQQSNGCLEGCLKRG